jgi:hypothetical protein
MLAVAALAALLWLARALLEPPPSPFRYVVWTDRDENGRTTGASIWTLDLRAPPGNGCPDGATRYRELINRLKKVGAEYTVTSPRGYTPRGDPIY